MGLAYSLDATGPIVWIAALAPAAGLVAIRLR